MRKNKKAALPGGPENTTHRNNTALLRRFQRGTDCLIEVAGSIALGIWVGTVLIALLRAATS